MDQDTADTWVVSTYPQAGHTRREVPALIQHHQGPCALVLVCFLAFLRVGTWVHRRGLWTNGGLWTGVGYLSGSMEGILSSHEPTGPACGCLTLFMFMKVNANGRAVQSLVIWSSLGVQSYAPFWPDTADTSGSIHPPKIPHERAGLGRLTTHLHGPHVHAN